MKCARHVQEGKEVGKVMHYLIEPPQPKCPATSDKCFLDSKVLIDAYKHVANR